ncbi:hypothetical protein KCP76_05910 [Salmonella enterica subsp. enterica serovar Weltevreden]|nr:hypothetical protein KCP76_05910 [Salmonella enterica subsp. enterica serovar Weltevreden]
MAQPFSYRYPLVDGRKRKTGARRMIRKVIRGNVRYTESRLFKYAELLLLNLGRGRLTGAKLTARCRNRKCYRRVCRTSCWNGTTGIAVGMATDIPPHNLREVAKV